MLIEKERTKVGKAKYSLLTVVVDFKIDYPTLFPEDGMGFDKDTWNTICDEMEEQARIYLRAKGIDDTKYFASEFEHLGMDSPDEYEVIFREKE